MIMVTATITAKSGQRNKIISKSKDLITATRLESGCVSYCLYESNENENSILILEQWKDLGALESHMQTRHFKAFGLNIKDFVAKDANITVYSADKI